MKRDRDETDFRKVRGFFNLRVESCPFCNLPSERVLYENELAVAIRDAFPVTPLHTLVIRKRHVTEIFDLSRPEVNAHNELMKEAKRDIEQTDLNVSGFNVGVNNGRAAGQTVEHCHVHLIPRRVGDVENPVGGIRKAISAKPS